MKGVEITKIDLVHEDERRGIWEIMNGQMAIKNMKILKVTEDSYLGGHWHVYGEVMHILEGEAVDYKMKNIDTGEEETYHLVAGDTVFRTGRIEHGGTFKKGTIVIDGACEMYISADFNDIQNDMNGNN